MTLLFATLALADSGPVDHQGDFALPARADAPTDAVLLFDTNNELRAEVVEGPGAPFTLEPTLVLAQLWGNESLVSYTHAWEAGATYRVVVEPQVEYVLGTGEIVFTVGAGAAEAPPAPVLVNTTVGDWSEQEDTYTWGCCHHTRVLTFEVENPSDDPWAYVELVGLFEGESQITTTPGLERLDVGIGPGTHSLTYVQWEEDGVLQPANFEIAVVSAGGVRGEIIPVAFADDLGEDTGGDDTGGGGGDDEARLCGTPVEAGLAPLALAVLLASRRRARRG